MKTARKTYTAVTRSNSSYCPATGTSARTWDCGHKHRTALAAYRCLRAMGMAGCAYHATIEDDAGNKTDMSDLECAYQHTT